LAGQGIAGSLAQTEGKGDLRVQHRLLRLLAGSAASVLDLGCGGGGPARQALSPARYLGVDLLPPPHYPEPLLVADISDLWMLRERFDVALALDAIEHLTPERGFALLIEMARLAQRAVLFTPLGHLWQGGEGPHAHHSGWEPEWFLSNGWQVWAWPQFHHFPDGAVHGAFWAWKTFEGEEIGVHEARERCLYPV
jgi:SAM-dependent methyltransferase